MIDAEKANFPIRMMCDLLEVSSSGYYAWRRRVRPCKRRSEDLELGRRIEAIFEKSGRRYGSPRIYRQLKREGARVSRKRVERIMRERGLWARKVRRYVSTTDSNHGFPAAPDLLRRNFTAQKSDQVWVGDITYIDTRAGTCFLAVLVDLHTRRVVGWSLDVSQSTKLILEALNRALGARAIEPGMIHHSDRGVQYASGDYRRALSSAGIRPSMSRRGNCLDNAVAESFFGTLKQELVHRSEWSNPTEARRAIAAYIDGYYNTQRLHSTLGYRTPAEMDGAA